MLSLLVILAILVAVEAASTTTTVAATTVAATTNTATTNTDPTTTNTNPTTTAAEETTTADAGGSSSSSTSTTAGATTTTGVTKKATCAEWGGDCVNCIGVGADEGACHVCASIDSATFGSTATCESTVAAEKETDGKPKCKSPAATAITVAKECSCASRTCETCDAEPNEKKCRKCAGAITGKFFCYQADNDECDGTLVKAWTKDTCGASTLSLSLATLAVIAIAIFA